MILSAPHGGTLEPSSIPDRVDGCSDGQGGCVYEGDSSCSTSDCNIVTVRDSNTIELTNFVAAKIEELLGGAPHVIICNLRR